jgi:hypothetical protein
VAEFFNAEVAKLVYALDLGSSAARRESSSLSFRTKLMTGYAGVRSANEKPYSNTIKRKYHAGFY